MRRYKKPLDNSLLQVDEFSLKKRRIRKVLEYIKYKYFVEISPKEDISENEELISILKKNWQDILWFYEGSYIYNRCLRLLSIRPRSEKEISDFILKNSDNPKTKNIVIEKLSSFIDDYEFAQYLVQKERSRNPKGDRVIRFKLLEKGIEQDVIDEILNSEEVDVNQLILIQYEKKKNMMLSRIRKQGSANILEEFKMKMKNYLFSKGFSSSQIDQFFRDNEVDI